MAPEMIFDVSRKEPLPVFPDWSVSGDSADHASTHRRRARYSDATVRPKPGAGVDVGGFEDKLFVPVLPVE